MIIELKIGQMLCGAFGDSSVIRQEDPEPRGNAA